MPNPKAGTISPNSTEVLCRIYLVSCKHSLCLCCWTTCSIGAGEVLCYWDQVHGSSSYWNSNFVKTKGLASCCKWVSIPVKQACEAKVQAMILFLTEENTNYWNWQWVLTELSDKAKFDWRLWQRQLLTDNHEITNSNTP
jgi:hypothetical protein